jgi:hypothetical protein
VKRQLILRFRTERRIAKVLQVRAIPVLSCAHPLRRNKQITSTVRAIALACIYTQPLGVPSATVAQRYAGRAMLRRRHHIAFWPARFKTTVRTPPPPEGVGLVTVRVSPEIA